MTYLSHAQIANESRWRWASPEGVEALRECSVGLDDVAAHVAAGGWASVAKCRASSDRCVPSPPWSKNAENCPTHEASGDAAMAGVEEPRTAMAAVARTVRECLGIDLNLAESSCGWTGMWSAVTVLSRRAIASTPMGIIWWCHVNRGWCRSLDASRERLTLCHAGRSARGSPEGPRGRIRCRSRTPGQPWFGPVASR